MTLSLSPARRVLLAGGFALAVSAAPLVAAVTTTAGLPGTPLASCPDTEVLDAATGKCRPAADVIPSTLNPIEPANVPLQPGGVTSSSPGEVGRLPEVNGIPCTGANTGECIGLSESEKGAAKVPTVVPEVTG